MGERGAARLRVRALDELRGFSVISMAAYHAVFDLVHIFGRGMAWYTGTAGYLWQQSICWAFILVSGASLHHGSCTLRRALLVLAASFAVSAVTYAVMPQQRVLSGVLSLLGLSMLAGAALRRRLLRIPPLAGFAVCLALFALTKALPGGYLGFFDLRLWAVPRALYGTPFLFWLGLPGAGFFSADYFPLFPWLFLYFAGFFVYAPLKGRLRARPPGKNPVEWAGRHSLLLYMAHQPLIYGALLLLRAAGLV